MITYQYSCPSCGAFQEEKHSIKANPAITCKLCGQAMARSLGGGILGISAEKREVPPAKAAAEMTHAQKVVRTIKGKLQPKTRRGQ